MPQATHIRCPRIQAFWRLAKGSPELRIGNRRNDRGDNRRRDLILHGEYIFQRPIEAFRPDMIAGPSFDQLGDDTNPTAAAAHTSFEHVADAHFTGHLLNVNRAPLIGEAGVARDNEQRATARKLGDNVIGNAIESTPAPGRRSYW